LTVQNLQKGSSALVYHEFQGATSTFTASCSITRASDTIAAGMILCLNIPTSTGYITGYEVLVANGYISLNKLGSTWASLWGAPFRSLLTDALMVSKQGNSFTVFCNGVFLGSCTDAAPIASGDFGFVIQSNKATAVFDNALFTNQFTAGSFPVAIIDSFNAGAINPRWVLDAANYFTENDSVLVLNAPKDTQALCFARVAVGDTFAARVIVSNHGGDSSAFYGLLLYGLDTSGAMNIASFGITGNQFCKAYQPGVSFSPKYKPQIINGIDFPFNDTIDAVRAKGSNAIIMFVNGYPLDTMLMDSLKFTIAGAGIFNTGNVKIFADYFYIGPAFGYTPPSSIIRNKKVIRTSSLNPLVGNYFFDPLGRKIVNMKINGRENVRTLAPGFYVSRDGKKEVVVGRVNY
jgi:hypothetical protein